MITINFINCHLGKGASGTAVHHPHKSGIGAECIWKQHVKLYEGGVGGGRGGLKDGGVRKVGRVQLGRAAAAA